jgi:hypothetical protein
VTAFPHPVREVEHCWIPMDDGVRLAARIWLPADAETSPVPAILEYIPYRKRDFTRGRDEPMHRYFAGHGYAGVRVDVRGTGESEGVLLDEYLEREIVDGLAVIAWLAAQPWCTGAVGMMGKSWGGFNALQVAARRPPALRAIITVCASDDRYADDAHYMGGCLLNENLTWGTMLLATAALPPDPALVGARWRAMWRARLEAAVLFPEIWLGHPHRDTYWRQGSVCDELGRLACPVWAVGGWADAYTNAVPRLVAGLRGPRRGLVGPWSHVYPHTGVPGPAIGFLQEALRWWDRWLKGIDGGVMDGPPYRVWMQESMRPSSSTGHRPGRWVAEPAWPSPRISMQRWALGPGRLDATGGGEPARVERRSPQTVGLAGGDWCSFGLGAELPGDQREDDAGSLTFDSAPLAAPLEILGAPAVVLAFEADRSRGFVAVRLNEVFPDGASARVTYGILNLAHHAGAASPEPLLAGERYQVRVPLAHVAHAFARGNRLRIAVSTSYWPIVWPSPEPVTLAVFTAGSHLELPVRPPSPVEERLPPLGEPEQGPPAPFTERHPSRNERSVARDPESGEVVYTVVAEVGGFDGSGPGRLDEIGLELGHTVLRRYRIRPDEPTSARAEVRHEMRLARGAWETRVSAQATLAATADAFELRARLDAFDGARRIASRRWLRRLRRV